MIVKKIIFICFALFLLNSCITRDVVWVRNLTEVPVPVYLNSAFIPDTLWYTNSIESINTLGIQPIDTLLIAKLKWGLPCTKSENQKKMVVFPPHSSILISGYPSSGFCRKRNSEQLTGLYHNNPQYQHTSIKFRLKARRSPYIVWYDIVKKK